MLANRTRRKIRKHQQHNMSNICITTTKIFPSQRQTMRHFILNQTNPIITAENFN